MQYVTKVTSFKNLVPIAIDTEYEGLRRIIPANHKNIAVINFFTNEKEFVGIYIYMGSKLIGIRYLYKSLYDTESIISEVERMIVYCKTFYREFEIEKWFVFGKEEYIEDILKVENVEPHELSSCSFAASAGLALKEEYEKRRIKESKRKTIKGGEASNGI